MAWIMPVFVACSTIGSANGVILTSSRLFYAGAREGQMPAMLTMINEKTLTPMPAVIFTVRSRAVLHLMLLSYFTSRAPVQGILSLGYLALSGNIFSLINYVQIVYFLAIGVAILALFWLRRIMPDSTRPIKVVALTLCPAADEAVSTWLRR